MPTQNVEPDFFEAAVTRFEPVKETKEFEIKSVKDLDRLWTSFASEKQLVVCVTAIDADGCDMGTFGLFLNRDRAWIHLTEGACHTARDSDFSPQDRTEVVFRDDAGREHRIPSHKTTSRDLGIKALRHWLPNGERLPELSWGSA